MMIATTLSGPPQTRAGCPSNSSVMVSSYLEEQLDSVDTIRPIRSVASNSEFAVTDDKIEDKKFQVNYIMID